MNAASQLLERFLLALTVWREARGETPRGRRLVAATIANRVRDTRWPNSVEGVVLQPWQFSCFLSHDPNATKFPTPGSVWDDCVSAADAALFALSGNLPLETEANHYHVTGLDPAWRDESKIVATEGHHVFYKL